MWERGNNSEAPKAHCKRVGARPRVTRLAIEEEPGIIIPFIREMALTGIEPTCYASHLARLYLGLEVPPNDVMDEAGFGEELLEMPLVKYACIRSYIYFKLGMRFVNPVDISQKAEAYSLRRSYGQGGGQPVGAFVAVFCVGVSLEIWCLLSFS